MSIFICICSFFCKDDFNIEKIFPHFSLSSGAPTENLKVIPLKRIYYLTLPVLSYPAIMKKSTPHLF